MVDWGNFKFRDLCGNNSIFNPRFYKKTARPRRLISWHHKKLHHLIESVKVYGDLLPQKLAQQVIWPSAGWSASWSLRGFAPIRASKTKTNRCHKSKFYVSVSKAKPVGNWRSVFEIGGTPNFRVHRREQIIYPWALVLSRAECWQ